MYNIMVTPVTKKQEINLNLDDVTIDAFERTNKTGGKVR